jgi:hypothetical protein
MQSKQKCDKHRKGNVMKTLIRKVTRKVTKKIIGKLFGSIIMELVGEDKNHHVGNLIIEHLEEGDFVSNNDYDLDDFVSMQDYDFDDFVRFDQYDFDSMLLKQDVDLDDYITRTQLDDELDGFDPDDYVRADDFDPNDYDFEDFVNVIDLDEYVKKDELSNTHATQSEVVTFLTKLTLCATNYCTIALEDLEESNKS